MINFNNAKLNNITNKVEEYPTNYSYDFVFVGRSNVGKSTFINTLTRHNKLAYYSKKAGKTKAIGFYDIDQKIYFVDVPGYGFAKTSKDEQKVFGKMMQMYFNTRKTITMVFCLTDAEVGITQDDIDMISFLKSKNILLKIIMNKADKANQSQMYHNKKRIVELFEVDPTQIIEFSSVNKRGLNKVHELINILSDNMKL